jgi:hypothetical protein
MRKQIKLERLLAAEDEGQMVRDAAERALSRCKDLESRRI